MGVYMPAITEVHLPELTAITEWLADWARDINGWDHNFITLGDFNKLPG